MPTENENTKVTITDGTITVVVPEGVEVEVLQKEETVTTDPTPLDNALTLGLVAVLALAVIAVIIRKALSNKKAASAPVTEEVLEVAELPTAPGSAGKLKIHNVEPKTAAMLMAIVADKLQKPINELRFISIKEVE